jgi:uncharacterized protein YktB (UPF0637 family)
MSPGRTYNLRILKQLNKKKHYAEILKRDIKALEEDIKDREAQILKDIKEIDKYLTELENKTLKEE